MRFTVFVRVTKDSALERIGWGYTDLIHATRDAKSWIRDYGYEYAEVRDDHGHIMAWRQASHD